MDIISSKLLELVLEDNRTENDALASITLNPTLSWMKFVLLDDQPNGNGHRIPQEEFDNIIKTGIHMPLKVAAGEVREGHEESFPIGVITNLAIEGNKIIGLAALWDKERGDDVSLLKKLFTEQAPLNLSWELSYKNMEDHIDYKDLLGVSLNAATLVGMPAYRGRTPVIALASEETINKENNNMEKIEELTAQIEDLSKKFNDTSEALTTANNTITQLTEELEALRAYKKEIEDKAALAEKFASVKSKFAESKLELDDAYFEARKDTLLSMSDEALDFFIQEAVAFSAAKDTSLEASGKKIPRITSKESNMNPNELGRLLRQSKNK